MFDQLDQINFRPKPFEFYTASDLWTDDHTSKQMLAYHLNSDIDLSSRRSTFIDKSVEWISSHFNTGAGTRIADFGCGPGLYANRLARVGANVTGIDFSKRSIEHARNDAKEAGLKVEYLNQDYLEFSTENRYDIILMIMCDYCALSPVQRKKLLEKFQIMLTPGGSILLDVYSMKGFEDREETVTFKKNLLDGFWSPEMYYGFLNTFKYDDAGVVLDKYTIIEAKRTRVVYNWLQYFSTESLQEELEEAGFNQLNFYGNVAGEPFDESAFEFAVVGRRG